MRTRNSIRTLKANTFAHITNLFLGFAGRSIFLHYLGSEFLGLSSLFTSIISALSLLDLGLSSAVAYSLYKPLNAQDHERVNAIVHFFKTFYRRLAMAIMLVGLALTPFLQYVINDLDSLPFSFSYIQFIFLMFLTETSVSYFFAHKYTLMNVGQRAYRIAYVNVISHAALLVLRWGILHFTRSFELYVALGIVSKIVTGFVISRTVHTLFPFYTDKPSTTLTKSEAKGIRAQANRLAVHTLAGYVVNSTDNLIISTFVGLSRLGYYMNYYLIFSTIKTLLSGMIESFQASLGDLVAEGNKKRVYEVLMISTHGVYLVGSFSALSLLFLSKAFVTLWLGPQYIIDESIVWVSSISIFVWIMLRPLWKLSAVTGLFKEDVKNALAEAITNAVVSLILVIRYGIFGTLLGTIIAYVLAFFLKSRLQFTKYLEQSQGDYFTHLSKYLLAFGLNLGVMLLIFTNFKLSNQLLDFGLRMVLCVLIPNGINYLIFRKHPQNQYFIEKIIKRVLIWR